MEVIAVNPPRFKHQRVEDEIRQLAQVLPVGGRLPAERSLAAMYGCNFLTVRRALKQLVEDGTVVRRIGSGTFVARNASGGEGRRVEGERLGVLVWQGEDAYADRVLQGVAQEAAGMKTELRSRWVRDFGQEGLAQAKALADDGCVALILPWFPHDRMDEVRTFVRNSPLPVSLPMAIPGLDANCFERHEVFGNSLQVSVEQLCGYFQGLGRRRIVLLGPDAPGDPVLQRLLSAYACHTSRVNLTNRCGLVRAGAQAMDQLAGRWRKYHGDLAVVSYDDEHALRFMAAMHKLGLAAPKDFQIIGFSDTEAGLRSHPPLSTMRHNFNYVGYWLIKSALALARGEQDQSGAPPRSQLVVRATCGGAGRIGETLRQQLPALDIIEEDAEESSGAG